MGLPWRFISASAGIVTFVMELSSGEELALPGKFVMLMLSPVPLRVHRMRPEQKEYTPNARQSCKTLVLRFQGPRTHTCSRNALFIGYRGLRGSGRNCRAGSGSRRLRVRRHVTRLAIVRANTDCTLAPKRTRPYLRRWPKPGLDPRPAGHPPPRRSQGNILSDRQIRRG